MKSVEDLGVSSGKWYVGGEEDCITKTKLKRRKTIKAKRPYGVINEMKQTCFMLENSHEFAAGDSEVKSQVKALKWWTKGLEATFDKLENEKENAKTTALVSSVLFLISSMLYIVALMILM